MQGKSVTQTSGASVAIAFPAQAAGDLNVVAVMWGDTTASVSSVTDNKGNAYALAVGPTKGTGLTSSIYYAKNISRRQHYGDGDVQPKRGLSQCECSGIQRAGHCESAGRECGGERKRDDGEQRIGDDEVGQRVDCGSGQPEQRIQVCGEWIQQPANQRIRGISEDKIVSSTGSYNATATLTSGSWVMQMATFRASTP